MASSAPLNIDEAIAAEPCRWQHSHVYFPHAAQLQQVGFAGLFDTDVYIETSFSLPLGTADTTSTADNTNESIAETPAIQGALVHTFDKDNTESGVWVAYRVPAPIATDVTQPVIIELAERPHHWQQLREFITAFPWVSLLLFNVLVWALPRLVGTVLHYIDAAAIVVVMLVYAYHFVRFLVRAARTRRLLLGGHTVRYSRLVDAQWLRAEHVAALAPLRAYGVEQAAVLGGAVYLRHGVHAGGWRRRPLPADALRQRMHAVLAHISAPAFVSLFTRPA